MSLAGTGEVSPSVMPVESRAETVGRRALLVSCLITLTLPPVMIAVVEWGDAAAVLAYLVFLFVLILITVGLLYGGLGSRGIGRLVVLAAIYGLVSFFCFQGLEDPAWKEPDPQADALVVVFGLFHLLVAGCAVGLAIARWASRAR